MMNLISTLTESEEAKLLSRAQAERTTPEQLVRRAIQPILNAVPEEPPIPRKPKKSSRGALAHLGSAPSAEDIDEVRKEMFANFAHDES